MVPVHKERTQTQDNGTGAYVAVSNIARLPQDILQHILSYLCTGTLLQMKQVNTLWRSSCTVAIDRKLPKGARKVFQSNNELRYAVRKYSWHQWEHIERFATTYGYPINTWDVSMLKDLSTIFSHQRDFNEDISGWNVSNATSMSGMFSHARKFNQDLSSWNVSNVCNMNQMFYKAHNFSQSITSWNVSSVQDMDRMFCYARAFNQDLSSWNVSNVTTMNDMFYGARRSNQKFSSSNGFKWY